MNPVPTTPTLSRTAVLQWLPALLITALIVLSLVSGRPLVATGSAAELGVSASVPAEIFIDATNCSAASLAIGDLVPGTDPWKTAKDSSGQVCAIDFGTTNNTSGTSLAMLEDPAAPASPAEAMKCVGSGCGNDSLADFSGSAEPAAGSSAFGSQLLSATGIAAASWAVEPAVHAVQDSASTACTTSTIGTGTCSFTWGATAATSDAPGAYQAQTRLVVLAN